VTPALALHHFEIGVDPVLLVEKLCQLAHRHAVRDGDRAVGDEVELVLVG
jgi:hypothetical protein